MDSLAVVFAGRARAGPALQYPQNPNLISQAVLKNSLDSQTAFEIVSIDVAEIDVGVNIGANLQADQGAAVATAECSALDEVGRAASSAFNLPSFVNGPVRHEGSWGRGREGRSARLGGASVQGPFPPPPEHPGREDGIGPIFQGCPASVELYGAYAVEEGQPPFGRQSASRPTAPGLPA